ncbi:hypothetical protein D5086_024715 [Populus alba]|uniref:Uncharacterized protein n=1 Tax=Populus alba TaxID=43335 RepID=A0ACC4B7T6_POPAL
MEEDATSIGQCEHVKLPSNRFAPTAGKCCPRTKSGQLRGCSIVRNIVEQAAVRMFKSPAFMMVIDSLKPANSCPNLDNVKMLQYCNVSLCIFTPVVRVRSRSESRRKREPPNAKGMTPKPGPAWINFSAQAPSATGRGTPASCL